MKSICVCVSIACMFTMLDAHAQNLPPFSRHLPEKATHFKQLPAKISCSATSLQNFFSATINQNITVEMSASLKVEGVVIAKAVISPEQLSVNVRCSNFQDALLNISRIKEADGSFSYIGRMVSPLHGDVLLLWQENGQYTFIRQKQLLSMVE